MNFDSSVAASSLLSTEKLQNKRKNFTCVLDVVHDIAPQSFVFGFENLDQVLAIFTIGFCLPSGFTMA